MPTVLWAVRTALVDLFNETLDVPVFEGPLVANATPPKRFVLVGSDGGDDGQGNPSDDGAVIRQSPSALGNDWHDEDGDIVCAVWRWAGDTDMTLLRADVEAAVAQLESAIRADRTLGGVLVAGYRAGITEQRVRETQTSQGAVIRVAFTVSYRTLVTT
jgi:hypothetical protein